MTEKYFVGQMVNLMEVWPDYPMSNEDETDEGGWFLSIKDLEAMYYEGQCYTQAREFLTELRSHLKGELLTAYKKDLDDRWDKYPPVEIEGFFEGSFNDKGKK